MDDSLHNLKNSPGLMRETPPDESQEEVVSMLKEHEPVHVVCCSVPAVILGYTICALLLLEGCWIGWMFTVKKGPTHEGPSLGGLVFTSWKVLGSHNPFSKVLIKGLQVVALGDVVCAVLSTAGLSLILADPFSSQSALAAPKVFMATLLVWRILVILATAPWLGFAFAFQEQFESPFWPIFYGLAYIIVSLYIVWLYTLVMRVVVTDSMLYHVERERLLPFQPAQDTTSEAGGVRRRTSQATPGKFTCTCSGLLKLLHSFPLSLPLFPDSDQLQGSSQEVVAARSSSGRKDLKIEDPCSETTTAPELEGLDQDVITGHYDATQKPSNLDKERMIFGCMPLESGVMCYNIFLGFAFASVIVWAQKSKITSGGWVFSKVPWGFATLAASRLQVLAYLLGLASALLAAISILRCKTWGDPAALTELADVQLSLDEAKHLAAKVRRQSHDGVLVALFFNVWRATLFLPITGMVLTAKNVCNFHVRAFSSISTSRALAPNNIPVCCTDGDFVLLLCATLACLLDLYLIHSHFRLWWAYHKEFLHTYYGLMPPGQYGAIADTRVEQP